jgi:hypothetical protein
MMPLSSQGSSNTGDLSVSETDVCLAKAIRRVATKRDLDDADLATLRTLALSCAYRIEKLSEGASVLAGPGGRHT